MMPTSQTRLTTRTAAAQRLLTATALTLLHAATAAAAEIPDPVAYWNFEEVQDQTVIPDASGQSHAGVLVRSERLDGPLEVRREDGIRGAALVCGGSQQYGPFMAVDDPPVPDGPFTMTLWIRPGGGQWITRPVYWKRSWLSRDGFEIQLSSTTVALVLCPPGARKETRHWVRADRPVHVASWAFLAVRWDGEAWTLYLNGRRAGGADSADVAYQPPSADLPLHVGGYSVNTNNVFGGRVDEVRIFDAALTEEQVRQVMLRDLE